MITKLPGFLKCPLSTEHSSGAEERVPGNINDCLSVSLLDSGVAVSSASPAKNKRWGGWVSGFLHHPVLAEFLGF